MTMRAVVFEDDQLLAAGAAATIAVMIKSIASEVGRRVTLGLAGGSSPQATYERLRWEPVPWHDVTLWLSDERWVPYDHEDSNGAMAAATLADHVDARFLRPRFTEYMTPEDSAAFYESELRHLHADGRPDIVLLGMGTDGHTASLFPGTAALDERRRWFVHNEVPQLATVRLTATAEIIGSAHTVMVLTSGLSKREMVKTAFEGEPGQVPIQLLRNVRGDVVWMIDRAAADGLESTDYQTG
jgi:6-phosphogluconolactonase